MIAAQCSANRRQRTGNKTTDGRVLPARFSPSRVVRPSGAFPGSLLSVLRPLLTPALARWPLLPPAPAVSDRAQAQVSLSKNVNSRCTTGPFISGTEHRTVLCRASLSAPSTLYGLFVRRLISFDLWLPSHPPILSVENENAGIGE